jgi:hypothetical protein
MGVSGFCRVTDTHIRCLLEQYRRLLGEVQNLSKEAAPELALQQAKLRALKAALRICVPNLNLEALKPIRKVRPAILPGMLLTRGLLRALRLAEEARTTAQLTTAIAQAHALELNAAARSRLENRVARVAAGLVRRKVLSQQAGTDGPRWSV